MVERKYSLDLLRIFCCFCIIALHVSGHLPYGRYWLLVQGVVRPALWCFMTLSGYFLLSKPITDWKEFYLKHLTHLLIPLFLYTFLYQCYYAGRFQISFKSVLGGDTIGHLWFVYELLALYLLTPFLQKMLLALNNRGVFSFLALLFFFGRVVPILKNIGLPLGIPTELLGNCSLFFFVLGYALSVQKKTIRLSVLIPLGMVNILYIAYTLQNGILAPGAADLSAGMVIGTLFYFFLFQKCFAWLERTCFIKRAVDFISGRTYGIYLIHMLIFQIFTAREIMMLNPLSLSRYWMLPLKCVIIFLLGLAASIPLDLLICAPLQKGMMWLLCRIGISTKKKERMKP